VYVRRAVSKATYAQRKERVRRKERLGADSVKMRTGEVRWNGLGCETVSVLDRRKEEGRKKNSEGNIILT
jgi:hypothetical protein